LSNDLDNGYAVLQTSCIANDVEGKKGCNSSDALTIYEHEGEDGVWYDSYCYSCNQFFNKEQTHNSQVAIELGIKDGEVIEKKKFNPLPKSQPLKKEEVIEFTHLDISRYESGTSIPNTQSILKLCKLYNITILTNNLTFGVFQ
jgi:hypothetical protein